MIWPANNQDINYRILINHKKENEKVYFTESKNEDDEEISELELKWKYSLDYNIPYTLFIEINKHKYKLSKDFFKDYKDETIKYRNTQIKICKESDNGISIRRK